MTWTQFMDMHSGGGTKTDYEYIYIEADEDTAVNVFCNIFGEHPSSVACGCCGSNFSVSSYNSLEEATDYERGYGKVDLQDYLENPSIKVIYASDLTEQMVEDSGIYPYEDTSYWDDYEDEEN